MFRPTSRQATLYLIILFVGGIGLSFVISASILLFGLLLVGILLTVFITTKVSTLVASVLASLLIVVHLIMINESSSSIIFSIATALLLILMTAWLVSLIKQQYAAINFDKTHMTSLFENATEGIILTDKQGTIVLANPAAEHMFGYNMDEMKNKPIEILIPAKYRQSHVHLREGFLKAPQDRVMGHGRDLHGTKKTGENFPVEVSLSHYKRSGEPYVIAFIVDITGRKDIEQNMLKQQEELETVTRHIRKLNADLEAKVEERTTILKEALLKLELSQAELSDALQKERELNDIKSRFVSMASHEFRTPLSTILSSASLVGKYVTTEEQEKRDKHITRIRDSVKHLNNILEDFLSLGRLNEGKVSAQLSEFNLRTIISETIDEMKNLAKRDQQILLEYNGTENVESDKNLLRNILINLVSNAVKFSGEGSTVTVKADVDNNQMKLSVSDKGMGISQEDQEHLFSSFFRGKNVINIQGTGLGLHIVKRYIDLLDGEVYLQSELGRGTTVSLIIPIKQA